MNVEIFDEIFIDRVYARHFDIARGDTVVDIGANAGVFAAYSVLRGCDRVICAEPFSSNVAAIEQNVARNGFDNVEIEQAAIAAERGTARLYITEGDSGGNLLFDHHAGGPLEEFVEVPTLTLPDLLEAHAVASVDFLKMDCEGSEGLILANLEPSALRPVRRVAMEFHDNVSALRHDELARRLEAAGFRTWVEADAKSDFGYVWAENTRS